MMEKFANSAVDIFETKKKLFLALYIWIMDLQSISAQYNENILVNYNIGVKVNSAHNGLL